MNSTATDTSERDNISSERGALMFLLISLFFALFASGMLYVVSSPQLKELMRVTRTLNTALHEYHGDVDPTDMYENAATELYGMLDRYSGYAPKARYDQISEEFSGAYAGLGVSIISRPRGLLVASINEDGLARQGGLLLGDYIIGADSLAIVGLTTQEASQILRGPEGDTVLLQVVRPSGSAQLSANGSAINGSALPFDTLTLEIERSTVPLQHIDFVGVTANKELYIRINDFGAGMFDQFGRVFDSLRKIEPDYAGLLIDLRGNPGGLLGEALDLAEFFLEEDILMLGRKGRSYWSRKEIYSDGEDQTEGASLLIMVNRASASASEVFSGSLRFAGRAKLVGDTTFGKGLVQEYSKLTDGSASRLSVGRYYFAGEQYLNPPGAEKVDSGVGLAPDYYYEFTGANRFMRALGSRLLFIQFSARYQDWIVESFESGDLNDLTAEFEQYVTQQGFSYESVTLALATNLDLFVQALQSGRDARRVTHEIRLRAEHMEKNMYTLQQDRIIRRLAQLAYERRDGARVAFAKVDLVYDPDIKFCAQLLVDSLKNEL